MAINEKELNEVSGGYGPWQQYAKGTYVNYGQYIVYTVVGGDVLSGIAIRFGVTVQQICERLFFSGKRKLTVRLQIPR